MGTKRLLEVTKKMDEIKNSSSLTENEKFEQLKKLAEDFTGGKSNQ